jgi:hypothetical protein
MQHAARTTRRTSRHPRRPRISPDLLDEIAFTRSEIEQARSEPGSASEA